MTVDLKRFTFQMKIEPRTRHGLMLTLFNESGKMSVAEISPLPGHSKETLDDAEEQLNDLLNGREFKEEELYPSVSFGCDAAMYGLTTKKQKFSVPVCGLLLGPADEVVQKADAMQKAGYSHAKLKITGRPLEEARELIQYLAGKFLLRIDLNRSWTLPVANQFFGSFPPNIFEYIEEPLQNHADLERFILPFALDENLREMTAKPFLHLKNLEAFVVKPTLMGGYKRFIPLLAHKKKIILSATYESGIGIQQIAHLSHRLNLDSPIGIDTYSFLENDPHNLSFSEGKLWIPSR